MVIWLTGLSGVGKTTLAQALCARLRPNVANLVLLDGDVIRATLSSDLGYGETDRVVQISRIQRLAKLLADQGIVVIVAAVYANAQLLQWNRDHLHGYFEVYLKASLATVEKRDYKGIYQRARTGKTANVVGLDILWHEPQHPDLIFAQDTPTPLNEMVERLLARLPDLSGD